MGLSNRKYRQLPQLLFAGNYPFMENGGICLNFGTLCGFYPKSIAENYILNNKFEINLNFPNFFSDVEFL